MDDHTKMRVSIVGKDAVPKSRKGKFAYLGEYERQLKPGQNVRLVISEKDLNAAKTAWMRITSHRGHTRYIKQQDGSIVLYLWM